MQDVSYVYKDRATTKNLSWLLEDVMREESDIRECATAFSQNPNILTPELFQDFLNAYADQWDAPSPQALLDIFNQQNRLYEPAPPQGDLGEKSGALRLPETLCLDCVHYDAN